MCSLNLCAKGTTATKWDHRVLIIRYCVMSLTAECVVQMHTNVHLVQCVRKALVMTLYATHMSHVTCHVMLFRHTNMRSCGRQKLATRSHFTKCEPFSRCRSYGRWRGDCSSWQCTAMDTCSMQQCRWATCAARLRTAAYCVCGLGWRGNVQCKQAYIS